MADPDRSAKPVLAGAGPELQESDSNHTQQGLISGAAGSPARSPDQWVLEGFRTRRGEGQSHPEQGLRRAGLLGVAGGSG